MTKDTKFKVRTILSGKLYVSRWSKGLEKTCSNHNTTSKFFEEKKDYQEHFAFGTWHFS